jgi:hypothetical protein
MKPKLARRQRLVPVTVPMKVPVMVMIVPVPMLARTHPSLRDRGLSDRNEIGGGDGGSQ